MILICQEFKVDHEPQLQDYWVVAALEGESYGNLP